jgi:hypothetical protein
MIWILDGHFSLAIPMTLPRFFIILDNFLITIMESSGNGIFMNHTCRSGECLNGCVEQCGALIIKYSREKIVDCQWGVGARYGIPSDSLSSKSLDLFLFLLSFTCKNILAAC